MYLHVGIGRYTSTEYIIVLTFYLYVSTIYILYVDIVHTYGSNV